MDKVVKHWLREAREVLINGRRVFVHVLETSIFPAVLPPIRGYHQLLFVPVE
jgi:hypothetical protein